MKSTMVSLLLTAAAATAQPSTDRQDQRWVCVPTEDRQWRCGRGAQTPEPRPLPPAPPPDAPPAGYEPQAGGSRLPDYLRESTDPADAQAATESPTEPEDESETAAAPDRDTSPPARRVEEAADRKAEPQPAPATARYSIQLVAGRDRASVEAYRDTPGLESLDLYRRTWEDAGGVWHVLLAGRFETVAAARQALRELPEAVRSTGAWVRPLEELDPPTDNPRNPGRD